MQFPWVFNSCSPTYPFSGIFTTLSINAECSNSNYLNMQCILVDHACMLNELKLETTSCLKTSCLPHKTCVSNSLFSGYWRFCQIISQNSMIFPWIFKFFQIPWFFHAWNFVFVIFQVFQSPWEPWSTCIPTPGFFMFLIHLRDKVGVTFVRKYFVFVCLFVFVALRPKSTAMVIAGGSVHLTTLFPGQAWTSG